jgi:hypothetical protein
MVEADDPDDAFLLTMALVSDADYLLLAIVARAFCTDGLFLQNREDR